MRQHPDLLRTTLLAIALSVWLMPTATFAQFAHSGANSEDSGPDIPPVAVQTVRPQADVATRASQRITGSHQVPGQDQDELAGSETGFPGGTSAAAGRRTGNSRRGTGTGERQGSSGQGPSGAAVVDYGGYGGEPSGPDNENGAGSHGPGGGLNSSLGGFFGGSRNSGAEELANGNGSSLGNSQQGSGSNSGSTGFQGGANSDGGTQSEFGYNANGRNSQHGHASGGNGNTPASGDQTQSGGGQSFEFTPSGNSARAAHSDSGNTNRSAGPNSGTAQGNSQQDDGARDDGSNRQPASDTNNQRNKNDNTSTAPAESHDNSDEGTNQSQKSAGSAPDRPEEQGWAAGSDPVGQAAARRRYNDLSAGRGNRDLLGEQRDAERTDTEGGLQEAAGRINPLTGENVVATPTSGGTSPLLREHVEISKRRRQGQ